MKSRKEILQTYSVKPLFKSEVDKLKDVKINGYNIQFICAPSEKIQLAAVNDYAESIRYILNPTEKVCLAAIRKDADVIRYITNPSETLQRAAIKKDCSAIVFISRPTKNIQLYSVMKGLDKIYIDHITDLEVLELFCKKIAENEYKEIIES